MRMKLQLVADSLALVDPPNTFLCIMLIINNVYYITKLCIVNIHLVHIIQLINRVPN